MTSLNEAFFHSAVISIASMGFSVERFAVTLCTLYIARTSSVYIQFDREKTRTIKKNKNIVSYKVTFMPLWAFG